MDCKYFCEDISNGCEKMKIPAVNKIDNKQISSFQYITENCLHKDVDESKKIIQLGCACEMDVCISSSCYCIVQGMPNEEQGSAKGNMMKRDYLSNPMFECNTCCSCTQCCPNRVVQNGLKTQLQVYRTHLKGWAVRALQDIKPHQFVTEYTGEVISRSTAIERSQSYQRTDINFLLAIKERFGAKTMETYLDATYMGNVARYINHSCNPNLVMCSVRIDSSIPRLAFYTCKDIKQYEELTFDYSNGDCVWRNDTIPSTGTCDVRTKWIKGNICNCESKNCRGFLPFDSLLFDED